MRQGRRIAAIIPALNEAAGVGGVLADLPDWIDRRIVVDNGSTDGTAAAAMAAGAAVVAEPARGYGAACLRGIRAAGDADILLFLDADHSDFPDRAADLVDPIATGAADIAIGVRIPELNEAAALTAAQRTGNALAGWLIGAIWGQPARDLGPFRAIDARALHALDMRDRGFGWTVEMQIKAARAGLILREVAVPYRRRKTGRSKISGTIGGSLRAGMTILSLIALARICDFTGQPFRGQFGANHVRMTKGTSL